MYISLSDFYDLYEFLEMFLVNQSLSEIGIIWTITDSLYTEQYVGRTTETKKKIINLKHFIYIYTATAVNNTVLY
jgi:hypothetical protein